jgi:uncharacterized protein YfiM (DUF2279 family)
VTGTGERHTHKGQDCADDLIGAQEYLSSQAPKDLRAAGLPLVEFHNLNRREKTTFFGGKKFVYDVIPAGRGWLIGDILWSFNEGRRVLGADVSQEVLTVLMESGNRYGLHRGLIRVRPDADHGGYLALGGCAEVLGWTKAACAIRTITTE